MKKTTTIVAVATPIIGRKNFVATVISTRSYDNRKLVDHTPDPEKAHDFGTLNAANEFIKTMVNPHGRRYTAEKLVLVSREAVKKIMGPLPADRFS